MNKIDYSWDSSLLSPSALYRFLTECPKNGVDLHSIEIFFGDKQALRLALPPYDYSSKQQLYSLSKSFTSVAIGMLWDAKKLSLDDLAADYFADRLPSDLSENARKIRIRDLLTMRAGHDECPFGDMAESYFRTGSDPIVKFFTKPIPNESGTHFCYNTGASYVLSAIVSKITGLSLLDFLMPRFFEPLHISHPYWLAVETGVNAGGVELHLSIDDLAKFGKLIWDKGVFEGKRIISEEYLELATSKQADNGDPASGSFWAQGYGFQFWQNARGGFRGDGAFGQVCLVRRDLGFYAVALTESKDMGKELNIISDLLEDAKNAVSEASKSDVTEYLENYSTVPEGGEGDASALLGRWIVDKSFPIISTIELDKADDGILMRISDSSRDEDIRFAFGKWERNDILFGNLTPDLFKRSPYCLDDVRLMCAATLDGDALTLTMRYLNTPHIVFWRIMPDGDNLRIRLECSEEGLFNGGINIDAKRENL
ncbi:MAG: serine hydrolase [Eubacteriales bacterium]|nr:serine hydrolase [Eubacteriales bacterium]MDD3881679.1 serine hydrolase [Eubacteriales bacterium]MDD4512262.1 serine hydrolase [Eubacteriales bacterium]